MCRGRQICQGSFIDPDYLKVSSSKILIESLIFGIRSLEISELRPRFCVLHIVRLIGIEFSNAKTISNATHFVGVGISAMDSFTLGAMSYLEIGLL